MPAPNASDYNADMRPDRSVVATTVDVATADGRMLTSIFAPDDAWPVPAVILLMDAIGIRDELRNMARRLAGAGYVVALPNLYYRLGVLGTGPLPAAENISARTRISDMVESVTMPGVMDDLRILIGHLRNHDKVDTGRLGVVGYCMSGRYAIGAAATFPYQVGAAASIYGTHLVIDSPDSPHRAAARAQAALYFACAEVDPWVPLETVDALRAHLRTLPIDATVELYPGTEHGFAFSQRHSYDRQAAEQHWNRLLTLFSRNLP